MSKRIYFDIGKGDSVKESVATYPSFTWWSIIFADVDGGEEPDTPPPAGPGPDEPEVPIESTLQFGAFNKL